VVIGASSDLVALAALVAHSTWIGCFEAQPGDSPTATKKNGAAALQQGAEEKSLGGYSKRTEGVGESGKPKSAGRSSH
jgi:hypothetical protein